MDLKGKGVFATTPKPSSRSWPLAGGLVVLVLLACIAVYWFISGIHKPDSGGSFCNIWGPVVCYDYKINLAGELSLSLMQSTGRDIIVTAAGCEEIPQNPPDAQICLLPGNFVPASLRMPNVTLAPLNNSVRIPQGDKAFILGDGSGNNIGPCCPVHEGARCNARLAVQYRLDNETAARIVYGEVGDWMVLP